MTVVVGAARLPWGAPRGSGLPFPSALYFLGQQVGDVLASLGQGRLNLARFKDLKPVGEHRRGRVAGPLDDRWLEP